MKKIFDFRCPDGHTTEHFVSDDVRQVRCNCGAESERIISPIRFHLEGASGHFPTATDKWIREHEKYGGSSE
jgi:hypothetical protein